MSTISAGTTSTTTLIHSGDTTGSLVFKTNDTGSGGTTALTINTSQAIGVGSSPSYGTSGQVLTSSGSGASPTWSTVSTSAATQTALGTVYGKQDTTSIAFYGYQAGNSNTGSNNTFAGYQAGYNNTSGGNNTAIGYQALFTNSTGSYATCVGYLAGYSNTTDTELTAFGYRAAYSNTTGSGGGRNTGIGVQAIEGNTTGYNNTAVGWRALKSVTINSANTAMGQQAGTNATGNENAFFGNQCAQEATSGNGNTCFNSSYGGSRIFSLTSESNRLLMGHNAITNAYVQVAWTVTSDARDKTDVVAAPYGLNFVTELRPIQYRWDRRRYYENGQPDGTHKEDKKQLGFLAQEVIALEKKYGGVEKDLLIADDEQDDSLKVTETKMIPVLVKAIQELKAINDQQAETINALTARVVALESK